MGIYDHWDGTGGQWNGLHWESMTTEMVLVDSGTAYSGNLWPLRWYWWTVGQLTVGIYGHWDGIGGQWNGLQWESITIEMVLLGQRDTSVQIYCVFFLWNLHKKAEMKNSTIIWANTTRRKSLKDLTETIYIMSHILPSFPTNRTLPWLRVLLENVTLSNTKDSND